MNARTRIAATTLFLLAVAGAAGGVAWFGVHLRGEERLRREARTRRLFDLVPESVTALRVEAKGGATRLVRDGGRWRIVEPVVADADQATVRALLERLSTLDRRAISAAPGERREELRFYGLDRPRTRIELTLEGGREESLDTAHHRRLCGRWRHRRQLGGDGQSSTHRRAPREVADRVP